MYHAFFLIFPFIAWLILLRVGVRPLKFSRGWTIALALMFLAASQKFVVYLILGGDPFNPELPAAFIHGTGWAYSSMMLLVGILCSAAIVKGVVQSFPRQRQRGTLWTTGSIRRRQFVYGLVAAGTAGWGVWEGVRVPRVKRTEIEVEGLPKPFDGFRIVQLSDLHCSAAARREHMQAIVAQVNTLDADVVCITGDFVDGSVKARWEDLEPLRDLKSRLGVFGCAGNHEYYSGYGNWRPVFEGFGVQMLDNAHRVFARGEARLVLGGIPDETAKSPRYAGDSEVPDIAKTFAGAPEGCRILMKHRPILLAEHADQDVRLQLSGHTHGGACLGMDLVVAKMGNENHLRGLYREGKLVLHVSPGTGQWAGFPLRLGVPAEVSELILRVPGKGRRA